MKNARTTTANKSENRLSSGEFQLSSKADASGVNYNLHTLGWASFQSLCGTILREVLGQTYQTFADNADAGRDGAFQGKWNPQREEEMDGSFVVQCKFTAKQDAILQVSQVADEFEKVRKLARKGLAKNYVLITNASLRAPVEAELRERFLAIRGVSHFAAFGGEWISEQIRDNKRLRTLVPRVYGLGDLTEILDERVYEQAKEILSWLKGELDSFVVTDSHHRSVQALHEKGFVFLLGDPGSGKSTIAAALALAAADTWQSRVVKVRHADDFTQHSNPNECNQFFWVDDAFGQTQYERERTIEWNHALQSLSAALKRGARAIFTSRTYIYKAAVNDLKGSLFPLLREAQVVIEVEDLTQREREQILYNHLRLGEQPTKFRRELKPFLPAFATHKRFLPETARRLGNPMFTRNVSPTHRSVLHFVAEPEEYIRDVITGLGDAERAALGLTFMAGGKLLAPLDLTSEESHAIQLMNADVGGVRKAIATLDGSLMVQEIEDGEIVYRFKHPTIRDAYGGVIGDDPNLMDVYLRGARTASLVHEITCGDVGLEGGRLIVPESRFSLITKRLHELLSESGGKRQLAAFLASRCSPAFLRHFMQAEPDFLSSVNPTTFPRPWLVNSQEVKLFATLHEHNLLP